MEANEILVRVLSAFGFIIILLLLSIYKFKIKNLFGIRYLRIPKYHRDVFYLVNNKCLWDVYYGPTLNNANPMIRIGCVSKTIKDFDYFFSEDSTEIAKDIKRDSIDFANAKDDYFKFRELLVKSRIIK